MKGFEVIINLVFDLNVILLSCKKEKHQELISNEIAN